jgi:uncharacterized protein DUF748
MRRVSRLVLAAAALAVLGVSARLALHPLVVRRTREALLRLEPGMRGTFSGVEIRVRDLSYAIRDLRVDKRAGGVIEPFFRARSARFSLSWKELLRGRLVVGVALEAPRLTVVQRKGRPGGEGDAGGRIEEVPGSARRLAGLAPFRVDHAQVRDGTLVFEDARTRERPRVVLHGVEATLDNFAPRRGLSRREPTVLAAEATLQRSGRVSVFATADPLARRVTFAGEGRLTGLQLVELQEVFAAKSHVEPDRGVLDMTVTFKAVDGRVTGGVRPVLKGAGTEPADGSFLAQVESLVSDSSLHLFSDGAGDGDPARATIPISGNVLDPRAQPIATVIGLLRNAFVRGLSDAFSGRAPPRAGEPGGAREQARRGAQERRRRQAGAR